MRLLVLGGSGMLGEHVVVQARERGHKVESPSHDFCDIQNALDLDELRERARPDAVINCAGVRKGEPLQLEMLMVNAVGPHVIRSVFKCHIVHVSTDCVYSGRQPKNGLWSSDQLPDPVDLYGRSKLLGELYENALTVRTSFLGLRHGLLPWIIASESPIEAWSRAYWNGGSARAVAEHLLDFAEQGRTGLVHLAAAQPVSKAWIVEYVLEALDRPVDVIVKDKPRIWRALEPDVELQPVKDSLDELLEEVNGS